MVTGRFGGNVPFVEITLAWSDSVRTEVFTLDTGFTGDLQVTPKVAIELGLQVSGITPVSIANGDRVDTPTAIVLADMEGVTKPVSVLISKGSQLAGIGFLRKFGYRATFSPRSDSIELERDRESDEATPQERTLRF
ncbi:MAG: hypothetical protein ACREGR_02715 [Minisyncoccia bacterium]